MSVILFFLNFEMFRACLVSVKNDENEILYFLLCNWFTSICEKLNINHKFFYLQCQSNTRFYISLTNNSQKL